MERDDDVTVRHQSVEEVDHHVSEAQSGEGTERRCDDRVERPLEREGGEQVSAEEADRAGDPQFRLALLGQHDEDVHDQENAREDSEGAHDQEELRRGATDLDRLCDSARLRILDAEGQMVARDTETEILCDLVRDRDTLHDPADIRDPDQVDGAVLVERGLRAPEIHEEDGPSFIRGGTLIADDVCHRGVDERLVRCPVEQGEVLTGGRVQVGRGTSVREHVVRSERARVERPSVARRERTEGPFIRGVQPHDRDLLVSLVARDVSDRHHLQQGGSDSVHRAFCGNQVRANLGEVRLREREELAAELVRDNFVDGTEPDIDVFEEDVTQCIADDEAGGNDRRADEEPEDHDDDPRRPASDVPRRESCEERPSGEQEAG